MLLAAVVIGTSIGGGGLVDLLGQRLGLSPPTAWVAIVVAAAALGSPFWLGLIRNSRALGTLLAVAAMPAPEAGKTDLAAAPRRAFVVTLQLAVLLAVGAPLVAATQPFLPSFQGAAVLVVVLAILGIAFWRSASELQEHAQAGAQAIVEVLASQAHSADPGQDQLRQLRELMPGLGDPMSLRLAAQHFAVGKTLADINLRGLTDATVLAIVRDGTGLLVPTGKETLRANDVLALAGSHAAVEAARELLVSGGRSG